MTEPLSAAPQPLSHESARALIERNYSLLNEHDAGHIRTVFTEDVEFVDDAWPESIRGHAQMERFLTTLWRAMPDLRFELVEGPYLAEDGRHAAALVRISGTVTGRFDPPGFAPTGARVTTEFGGFYEFEGERLKHGRIIVNMNDVGIQIGAAPTPGSRAERLALRMQHLNARRLRRRAKA